MVCRRPLRGRGGGTPPGAEPDAVSGSSRPGRRLLPAGLAGWLAGSGVGRLPGWCWPWVLALVQPCSSGLIEEQGVVADESVQHVEVLVGADRPLLGCQQPTAARVEDQCVLDTAVGEADR